ncbi:MAG TPA: hypothetical protein VND21_06900 [Planctomycetota bacterium]|nr:hypothetical protein [Planctomycetota bacterium]
MREPAFDHLAFGSHRLQALEDGQLPALAFEVRPAGRSPSTS